MLSARLAVLQPCVPLFLLLHLPLSFCIAEYSLLTFYCCTSSLKTNDLCYNCLQGKHEQSSMNYTHYPDTFVHTCKHSHTKWAHWCRLDLHSKSSFHFSHLCSLTNLLSMFSPLDRKHMAQQSRGEMRASVLGLQWPIRVTLSSSKVISCLVCAEQKQM